jgi:hypothetical protein
MSAIVPTAGGQPVLGPAFQGSGEYGGFSPADLRSAYKLPSEGGAGQTVAITIAYDDPNAEADLKTFRAHYGLPECTAKNGCFAKVNGNGEAANYPEANSGWAVETSLDLDMVSATCPSCHILLVEAKNSEYTSLIPAVSKAAEMGATVISDSWGSGEFSEETKWDPSLHHPGIPVLFSSGDTGDRTSYPAASPEVVAVGGTRLTKDNSVRGWSEAAWSGAGSGCSYFEAQPSWQPAIGCTQRTIADVAAVADPASPVSVYDSYQQEGWILLGGTSVAAPFMAGVEAISGSSFRAAGASAFYSVATSGELFDIVEGENRYWTCSESIEPHYLCEGTAGYDGPTGEGTPKGTFYLSSAYTEPASAVSASEATLHGTVNPEGHETHYHFEYDTKEYNSGEGPHGASVPSPAKYLGSGNTRLAVSETIKGLSSRTTYHYRTVATNSEGVNTYGADQSFGTTSPAATIEAATEVHSSDAVLHGSVNPEGADTHWLFEWGKTTSYGHTTKFPAEGIGSGTASVGVSRQIGGLMDETTYHYRLKATSSAGTSYSTDQSFTTTASEWQRQTLPAEPEIGSLTQISCSTLTDCMSVGKMAGSGTGFRWHSASEHWNGKEWAVVSMPSLSLLESEFGEAVESDEPTGISCSGPGACTAVGWVRNKKNEVKGYAARWNGSTWTLEGQATKVASTGITLNGVSCPTSTFCMAVGERYVASELHSHVFAMTWNGKEWASMNLVDPPKYLYSAKLNGVSCTTAALCMVVGVNSPEFAVDEGLAERWNGSEWTPLSVPAGADPGYRPVEQVSCTGSEVGSLRCMASNFYSAWTWSGTSWAAIGVPPPPSGTVSSFINGISCLSPTECIAAGGAGVEHGRFVPFAATWDGTHWWTLRSSDLADPYGGEIESFLGLSCVTPGRCVAVGHWESGEGLRAARAQFLIQAPTAATEGATGVGRTQATAHGSVNPNGIETEYFYEYGTTSNYGAKTAQVNAGSGSGNVAASQELSALSAGTLYHFRLVAKNSKRTTYGQDNTFTTGEWSTQTTPNPSPPVDNNRFEGVSCPSSTVCVGVGSEGTFGKGFVERWNGSEWKLTNTVSTQLKGISCPTTTYCIAIAKNANNAWQMKWLEGLGAWEMVAKTPPTPSGGTEVKLNGVSCTAETACTAVGSYMVGSEYKTLAFRWNGTSWSQQTTPNPLEGNASEAMLGVSCSSASFCLAVGKAASKPYAETWTGGTEWTRTSLINPTGSVSATLQSVSCTSSESCMAAGSYNESGGLPKPLTERLSGSTWSVLTTPKPSGATGEASLGGVICLSSSSCFASGSYRAEPLSQPKALAESWNGSAWTAQTPPNPAETSSTGLTAISCSSSGGCTAVGSSTAKSTGSPVETLAERYG